MANYYKYTHTKKEVNKLQEILTTPLYIPSGYAELLKDYSIDYVVGDFMLYSPSDNIPTNSDILKNHLIRNGYTEDEAALEVSNINPTILPGVTFNVPYEYANLEIVAASGINLDSKETSYKAFITNRIKELITDPQYTPVQKYGKLQIITDVFPQIEVWMWIRSLDKIVNVTSFVESVITNSNKNGGAFTLSLAPITNLPTEDYYNKSKHIVSEVNLFTGDKNNRSQFYFHKYVGVNDVVWIKFEQLNIEGEREKNGLYIDKSQLVDQVYDMIGLVDSNSLSINPENNDVKIDIAGRDLSKLFIEDGSYFIPISYVAGATSFFTQIEANKDKFFKRNFVSDEYSKKYLFANIYRDIATTMKFYINQCSSIGIVPSELFDSYKDSRNNGDKRSKTFSIVYDPEKSQDTLSTNPEPNDGLWQIVKLAIDDQLSNRRIADFSISQPDGTIQSQFQKVCQEPFVEYFTDTYGDTYNIIVRQPPFTQEAILSLIRNSVDSKDSVKYEEKEKEKKNEEDKKPNPFIIDIDSEDVISESLAFNEDDIYTFFQIDSGYVNFSGSNENILPFIPICYFPEYVNIWGNRKFQISDIYTTFETIKEKKFSENAEKQKVTGLNGVSGEIIKGIEYEYLIEAIVNDLKLAIDTYAYMPFVRKGTIVINGDRRIKKGMWIRHKGNKELCYVDEVTHSFSIGDSIDRTTTLRVSRCMVEKYIIGGKPISKGFEGFNINYSGLASKNNPPSATVGTPVYSGGGSISYFNIINTKEIAENIIKAFKQEKKINSAAKSKFSVNKEVFDFFLKRKQFEE